MLSYRAWQQEYGSDPEMVGSTMILDGHPFTMVGITPPGFFGETLRSDPPEVWIPLQQEPVLRGNELSTAPVPCMAARDRAAEAGSLSECASLRA